MRSRYGRAAPPVASSRSTSMTLKCTRRGSVSPFSGCVEHLVVGVVVEAVLLQGPLPVHDRMVVGPEAAERFPTRRDRLVGAAGGRGDLLERDRLGDHDRSAAARHRHRAGVERQRDRGLEGVGGAARLPRRVVALDVVVHRAREERQDAEGDDEQQQRRNQPFDDREAGLPRGGRRGAGRAPARRR